jgi:hypothetical protein
MVSALHRAAAEQGQPVNALLYPGEVRDRLLRHLLSQLLAPASLETVLNKLMVTMPATTGLEDCSVDEQLSQSAPEQTRAFLQQ